MPRKRRRPNWPLRTAVLTAVLLPVAYVMGMTFVSYLQSRFIYDPMLPLISRSIEACLLVFAFTLGACFGSFLNVVALRLPSGESINGHSHCPFCYSSLASSDNLPIFGWLGLRGRCRSCRLPIDPRYVIVELIAGLAFMSVCAAELITAGGNLPDGWFIHLRPFGGMLVWDFLASYRMLFHDLALCLLLTTGLMLGSRLSIPWSFAIFSWTVLVILLVVFPHLIVVPWQLDDRPTNLLYRYIDVTLTIFFGLAASAIVAFATKAVIRPGAPTEETEALPPTLERDWFWQWSFVGITFGWQAVFGIALFWAILVITIPRFIDWRRFPLAFPASLLFAATWFHLLCWRQLSDLPFWPGESKHALVFVAALAIAARLPRWVMRFSR